MEVNLKNSKALCSVRYKREELRNINFNLLLVLNPHNLKFVQDTVENNYGKLKQNCNFHILA